MAHAFIRSICVKNKLFLLSAAVIISSVNTSHAADVIYNSPEAPAYNESLIWGGAYIGGQVGYDWAKTSLSSNSPFFPDLSQKANGFVGGLYAGYNWEFSNAYVFGLEGDINYADLSQNTNGSAGINNLVVNASWNTRVQWEGAVRARFGINYDRWLPYIAGGVAFAGVKDNISTVLTSPGTVPRTDNEDISKTRIGFTIGAGVDYALTNNLLLRAEYRYSDYGKKDILSNNTASIESKLSTNNVRLGIAYKF